MRTSKRIPPWISCSFLCIMGQSPVYFRFILFSKGGGALRKTGCVTHYGSQHKLQPGAKGLTFEKSQREWLEITEPARATFHFGWARRRKGRERLVWKLRWMLWVVQMPTTNSTLYTCLSVMQSNKWICSYKQIHKWTTTLLFLFFYVRVCRFIHILTFWKKTKF